MLPICLRAAENQLANSIMSFDFSLLIDFKILLNSKSLYGTVIISFPAQTIGNLPWPGT